MTDSPRIRSFELVTTAVASLAIAVGATWPLVTGLTTRSPEGSEDSLFKAWEIGWLGHALISHPLAVFQSNNHYPLRDSLAFNDASVGYSPFAVLGSGVHATQLKYNLLLIFAIALALYGAFLLARELGASPVAALAAGVAFAFAPWRAAHMSHLHVLSSGGIPLALFLLARGYRRSSLRLVAAGWIVAAWQLSLGFTLGLPFAYLLGTLGTVAVAAWLWRGRPRIDARLLYATAFGAVLFSAVGLTQAQPYRTVAGDYPQARRSVFEVASLSPVPLSVVAAPRQSLLWGRPTEKVRASLRSPGEQSLFPGLTIAVLASLGIAASSFAPRIRGGLAAAVVLCALFSFGLHPSLGRAGSFLPYRLLHDFAPGWGGIRTPGRITTLTTLGLGMLAAAGTDALMRRTGRRRPGLGLRSSVGLLAAAAIFLEGLPAVDYPAAAQPPAGQTHLPGPQVHLPFSVNGSTYLYWSTDGFPALVNGVASFTIPSVTTLERELKGFPNIRTVASLRALGVRTVVFHPDLARGTPWQATTDRPVAGLGLTRTVRPGVVVYGIQP